MRRKSSFTGPPAEGSKSALRLFCLYQLIAVGALAGVAVAFTINFEQSKEAKRFTPKTSQLPALLGEDECFYVQRIETGTSEKKGLDDRYAAFVQDDQSDCYLFDAGDFNEARGNARVKVEFESLLILETDELGFYSTNDDFGADSINLTKFATIGGGNFLPPTPETVISPGQKMVMVFRTGQGHSSATPGWRASYSSFLTGSPTTAPTTKSPSKAPSKAPTPAPIPTKTPTRSPSLSPTTVSPTKSPTTVSPLVDEGIACVGRYTQSVSAGGATVVDAYDIVPADVSDCYTFDSTGVAGSKLRVTVETGQTPLGSIRGSLKFFEYNPSTGKGGALIGEYRSTSTETVFESSTQWMIMEFSSEQAGLDGNIEALKGGFRVVANGQTPAPTAAPTNRPTTRAPNTGGGGGGSPGRRLGQTYE